MNPKAKSVDDVIDALESQELHPTRQLARGLIAEYRKGTAIDRSYDFLQASITARQVIYNQIVVFYCWRSWWMRLLGARGYRRRSVRPLEGEE